MTETSIASSDKNKEAAGGVSCVLWIATGIYYFATTSQAHFFSWQGLLFFVGGGFASALVLGALGYYLLQAHRRYLYRPWVPGDGAGGIRVAGAITNLALNILQLVIPVIIARLAFQWLYA